MAGVDIQPDAVERRAALAVRGVRVAAPVFRRSGAGPSDDGHLLVDGLPAAIPLVTDSPYRIEDGRVVSDAGAAGSGQADGVDGADPFADVMVEPVARPRFYDLTTADGVPYHRLARLHGADVLATTVVQTCIRYTPERTRCRFCAIEASLEAGSTTRVKTPEQVAEVAEAAVRLDGVRQLVMTTGTAATPDRGARHLARCAAAVRAVLPDLPIQVQCEPPDDLAVLADLHGGRRHRHRHPRRVARRRRPPAVDAGQGDRAARRLLGGMARGRAGVRPEPGVDVPARGPRRGPRRAGGRRGRAGRRRASTRSWCRSARWPGRSPRPTGRSRPPRPCWPT